jgi:8-oxo-dGTP pyrophosphatase MutT (NUDIX family)
MSPVRPDLVECWIFRAGASGALEFLLIQRAADRVFPGIWQPVTGRLGPGERVPLAALREVREETGLGPAEIEAFYDLDQVASFFAENLDMIVSSVIFAVRVTPDAVPSLSPEHAAMEWLDRDEALRRSIWPPYRESIDRIERLEDPQVAHWFALSLDGVRLAS